MFIVQCSSNSLVGGLQFQPPLSLGCLDRGLERGQHGVRLGEDILVMGLTLGHGLQSLLGLGFEVSFAGEAGEQAEQDSLAGLLLTFEASAKILIRKKQLNNFSTVIKPSKFIVAAIMGALLQ